MQDEGQRLLNSGKFDCEKTANGFWVVMMGIAGTGTGRCVCMCACACACLLAYADVC
jgi:hypothetical protein